MSQIMKAFLGMFFILFLTAVSTGILSAYMQVVDAQDMHARMVDEVENSNFYPEVLKDCFAKAAEAGCRLSVTLYRENRAERVCTSSSMIPSQTQDVESAKLELTFPFQVAFFGIRSEHTIWAYAR